jgi:ABC-type spermidine/putrescine transport system permease subunit I
MSSVLTDVTYYPSFLRTLKIAFSQYVSLFIIAFVLATGFLRLLAKSDVFPLQESSDHREVLWSVKNRY